MLHSARTVARPGSSEKKSVVRAMREALPPEGCPGCGSQDARNMGRRLPSARGATHRYFGPIFKDRDRMMVASSAPPDPEKDNPASPRAISPQLGSRRYRDDHFGRDQNARFFSISAMNQALAARLTANLPPCPMRPQSNSSAVSRRWLRVRA